MCFYYLLHHHVVPEREDFRDGRRNCATFLYGSVLYAGLYAVLKNLRLRFGETIDAVLSAAFMVFCADVSVMAYTYKRYYRRSILAEVSADDGSWRYDEKTHAYTRRPQAELVREQLARARDAIIAREEHELELRELRDQLKNERERRQESKRVLEHKKRVAAARVIQRWWRDKLYKPPTGRFYQAAKQRFDDMLPGCNLVTASVHPCP